MFGLSRFEWLVLAVAFLVCPGTSFAQVPASEAASGATAPAPASSLFDRLDRNRDGYLSRDELASDEAKTRNWIAVDRDRDGRISRSEFSLVSPTGSLSQPSAAAGASQAPKKE